MDPTRQFLPGGSRYKPFPVYIDASTGQEVAVNTAFPFSQGCTCASRGSECSPSTACSCDDRSPVDSNGVCQETQCYGCNEDGRSRCLVYPGCECRRNRKEEEYFGCTDACHARRGECDNHVRMLFGLYVCTRSLTVRREVHLATTGGFDRD